MGHGTTCIGLLDREGGNGPYFMVLACDSNNWGDEGLENDEAEKFERLNDNTMVMMSGDSYGMSFIKAFGGQLREREVGRPLPLGHDVVVRHIDQICTNMVIEDTIQAIVAGWEFVRFHNGNEVWKPYLVECPLENNDVRSVKLTGIGSGSAEALGVLNGWKQKPKEERTLNNALIVVEEAMRYAAENDEYTGGYLKGFYSVQPQREWISFINARFDNDGEDDDDDDDDIDGDDM